MAACNIYICNMGFLSDTSTLLKIGFASANSLHFIEKYSPKTQTKKSETSLLPIFISESWMFHSWEYQYEKIKNLDVQMLKFGIILTKPLIYFFFKYYVNHYI